jgi:membrane fusion protein
VSTHALFRDEVLQAQRTQWLGAIRIARRPSFAWVTAISVALVLGLAAFATWGQVTRKARLPGWLVPAGGLMALRAPNAGVLAEGLVAEGEAVQQGQALARIVLPRHSLQGDTHALSLWALNQRQATLEAEARLLNQQAHQRHDALADRIRSLAAEERQALADEATVQQRVQQAQRN